MVTRFAPLFVVSIGLLGCGGGNTPSTAGGVHQGIYRGHFVDEDGITVLFETEQYVRGGTLTGNVRIIRGDDIYHGQMTGTSRSDGHSWTSPLAGENGTVTVDIDNAGQALITVSGGPLKRGAGAVSKLGAATTDSIAGTYDVVWTASGDSQTFCVVISNQQGQDVIPEQVVKLPNNGGFIYAGTVIGNSVSLSIFSGAGIDGVVGQFKPTNVGQSGPVDFEIIGNPGSRFSGTWTITKAQ